MPHDALDPRFRVLIDEDGGRRFGDLETVVEAHLDHAQEPRPIAMQERANGERPALAGGGDQFRVTGRPFRRRHDFPP